MTGGGGGAFSRPAVALTNIIVVCVLWCVVGVHTRCICLCVELNVILALPDLTGEGTNSGGGGDIFQSGLLCPCKLNFMYVCVCVYTSQFMYNKLYIYFYDLYSPVSSFFMCVCMCVHE